MAYTSIDDPSAYFHVQLYTGTGSTQSVGNDGNSDLKPDWVWIKKETHQAIIVYLILLEVQQMN